jgi:cystathionine beta-lyase
MGIADMDFRGAPAIKEALEERIKHNNWGYEDLRKSYIEAIVQWNSERHGYKLDPSTVRISSGVHTPLIAALNAYTKPSTKVLLNTPTYNGFYGDLRWSRTEINDSEMYKDDDGVYHIDWDDFEARMTPDTYAFILCNPQNPTGNMWSEDDLMRMGELCLKNEIIVLADEIHCDFVMKGQKYIPFASLPDKAIVDNSITMKAISKTFSLASMKSAYYFSTNPAILDRVDYMHRADLNSLGIVANEAAYRHGKDWFDQLLPYIDENHNFAEAYIKEKLPLVKYKKAQGTYLAWLDVSGIGEAIDAEKHAHDQGMRSDTHYLEQWFVDNAKVQINPGRNYGTGGNGHMRMNLGTPRPFIKKAIDNIASAISNI